jgi:hypothetical protein
MRRNGSGIMREELMLSREHGTHLCMQEEIQTFFTPTTTQRTSIYLALIKKIPIHRKTSSLRATRPGKEQWGIAHSRLKACKSIMH